MIRRFHGACRFAVLPIALSLGLLGPLGCNSPLSADSLGQDESAARRRGNRDRDRRHDDPKPAGNAVAAADALRAATHEEVVQSDPGLIALRAAGMLTFTTPITRSKGYGDGPYDPAEVSTTAFGHRPTLQGNGLSLRVNGLDAQACNECHTIVSADTRPPTLGIAGVGTLVANSIIMPTLIDVYDSDGVSGARSLLRDGIADFDGRFANPPFLYGGGGIELLGKEMTAELQQLLAQARSSRPGTVTELVTHGVNFGRILTETDGNVELRLSGMGPLRPGERTPEEILVVRPFGRKGEFFSMRDFDRAAMQFHFGMQPVEVVGADTDSDGDGVVNEVPTGELTTLHVFDVTNPPPAPPNLASDEARRGQALFAQVRCSQCHIPSMATKSRYLPLAFPEVGHDPDANVYKEIDLTQVGFRPDPKGEGVIVPMFSDLKRHRMGPILAETFADERTEVANDEFITARLWGIADTAPYLHDGRATTLEEAIALHGGEAQGPRDAFMRLSGKERAELIAFLRALKVPRNPNGDILSYLGQ